MKQGNEKGWTLPCRVSSGAETLVGRKAGSGAESEDQGGWGGLRGGGDGEKKEGEKQTVAQGPGGVLGDDCAPAPQIAQPGSVAVTGLSQAGSWSLDEAWIWRRP